MTDPQLDRATSTEEVKEPLRETLKTVYSCLANVLTHPDQYAVAYKEILEIMEVGDTTKQEPKDFVLDEFEKKPPEVIAVIIGIIAPYFSHLKDIAAEYSRFFTESAQQLAQETLLHQKALILAAQDLKSQTQIAQEASLDLKAYNQNRSEILQRESREFISIKIDELVSKNLVSYLQRIYGGNSEQLKKASTAERIRLFKLGLTEILKRQLKPSSVRDFVKEKLSVYEEGRSQIDNISNEFVNDCISQKCSEDEIILNYLDSDSITDQEKNFILPSLLGFEELFIQNFENTERLPYIIQRIENHFQFKEVLKSLEGHSPQYIAKGIEKYFKYRIHYEPEWVEEIASIAKANDYYGQVKNQFFREYCNRATNDGELFRNTFGNRIFSEYLQNNVLPRMFFQISKEDNFASIQEVLNNSLDFYIKIFGQYSTESQQLDEKTKLALAVSNIIVIDPESEFKLFDKRKKIKPTVSIPSMPTETSQMHDAFKALLRQLHQRFSEKVRQRYASDRSLDKYQVVEMYKNEYKNLFLNVKLDFDPDITQIYSHLATANPDPEYGKDLELNYTLTKLDFLRTTLITANNNVTLEKRAEEVLQMTSSLSR